MMTVKVASNLFMDSSFSRTGRLYQFLVSKIADFRQLGSHLVRQAQAAQAVRQVDRLQELGTMLSSLPISEYRLIGQYYLAWCMSRSGKEAHRLFEEVVESSSTYRAMALIELASSEARRGDFDSSIKYYTQAIEYSEIPYTFVLATRSIAAIKGLEGFHMQAVKDLEKITSLVKYSPPIEQYQYRNSCAVELYEVGRKYEARNIIQTVVASPFAIAYPEWRETAEDLKEPNRSFAVIDPSPARMGKLLTMPAVERVEPTKQDRPAPVINIETWKAKMGKKKNGDKSLEGLDSRQLLLRLMELGTSQGMTDDKLYKVVAMMEKLLLEPDEPQKPDNNNSGA